MDCWGPRGRGPRSRYSRGQRVRRGVRIINPFRIQSSETVEHHGGRGRRENHRGRGERHQRRGGRRGRLRVGRGGILWRLGEDGWTLFEEELDSDEELDWPLDDEEEERTDSLLEVSDGGYDEAFVENLDAELECAICLLAMRDPVLTICGHKFCKSCLSKLQTVGGGTVQCCQCRRELYDALSQTFPANDCKRKILSLKVRCRQREDGCDWVGELRRVETHQTECRAVTVACENACGESVPRWQIDDHLEQTCSKRFIECPYCKKKVRADQIERHHSTRCKQKPEVCAYCCKKIERSKRKEHFSPTDGDCPDFLMKCCYAEVGCKFEMLSKFKLSMEAYVGINEPHGTIIWAFQLPFECERQSRVPLSEESPVYTCDGGYRMSFTVTQHVGPVLVLYANMLPQEAKVGFSILFRLNLTAL
ncbi:TNF receptor-associated factor 6-B-like isoform X2 [Oscarella lobularis]|uniref:TNF receptor-associated factor 6-B-like isoform X2 n=1 Tax=Oscarella lobularis TaxID=121494 RepID=UPI0033133ACF